MKRLLLAVVLACGMLFAAPPSFAQSSGTSQPQTTTPQPGGSVGKQTTTAGAQAAQKTLTPQQKKMKDCSHEAKAKGFRGDQRKQFMSNFLKSE